MIIYLIIKEAKQIKTFFVRFSILSFTKSFFLLNSILSLILSTALCLYLSIYLSIYLSNYIYIYIYICIYIIYIYVYIIYICIYNIYMYIQYIFIYIYILLTLGLIERDGGLTTLCHSCWFACHQRVLNTFPGPGYLHSKDGVVRLWHLLLKFRFNSYPTIFLKVQSSPQTKIKPFYCTKFVRKPVKGFHLVR